jgi:cytochrome c5
MFTFGHTAWVLSDVEEFMSDPHSTDDHDGPHEGPIKTPKQLIVAVLFSFVVPIIGIILLVMYVDSAKKPAAGSDAFKPQSVLSRIQPVGAVQVKDSSAPVVLLTGEQVYAARCTACHAGGLAGAPKFGDNAAWAPRLGQGYDVLLTHVLKGKGAMAAQGGGEQSDLEIGRAVVYMANKAGAKFPEPKVPEAAAGASAPSLPTPLATPPATAVMPAPAVSAVPPAAPTSTSSALPVAGAVAAIAAGAAVKVAMADTPSTAGAAPKLYTAVCQACHVAGLAGSPKLGDKAAWAPRLGQGIAGLTASVVKGKGAMPAKGGSAASEAEIREAVTYMVSTVK